jgi:hypothetical protein
MNYLKKNIALIVFLISLQYGIAQVGINTNNPMATLDIEASNLNNPLSTDGILIPRIDAFPLLDPSADQNGIFVFLTTTVGNKASGFYYWNNLNNSWDAVGIDSNNGHFVGELYGGGIVFYVYNKGQHGLIASLDDLDGSNGVAWSGSTSTNIGITARSYYDGAANTAAIIAENSTPNKAATLCDSYSNGGFTDWYLPSAWELNLLYDSASLISNILANDGNPSTNPFSGKFVSPTYSRYWSSTEKESNFGQAWICTFAFSTISFSSKSSNHKVRAIRNF